MGKERLREWISGFKRIKEVSADREGASYDVLYNVDGKEIRSLIIFTKIYGEWKIDRL